MTTTSLTQIRRREGLGFWVVAFAFYSLMAFTTAPTPLWSLFARHDRFSSLTITLVFAVYAVAVALSLFFAGHLSDWYGRRRMVAPALALNVLAALVFVAWPQLPGLLVARVLSGLGVGAVTATATVWLAELDAGAAGPAPSPDHRSRGEPRRARARRTDRGRYRAVGRSRPHASVPRSRRHAGARAARDQPRPGNPDAIIAAPSVPAAARVRPTAVAESILRRCRRRRDHVLDLRADHVACAELPGRNASPALARARRRRFIRNVRHRCGRADADRIARCCSSCWRAPSLRYSIGVGLITLAVWVPSPSFGLFLAGDLVAGAGAGLMFKGAIEHRLGDRRCPSAAPRRWRGCSSPPTSAWPAR